MSLLHRAMRLLKPFIEKFPRVATVYRGMRDQFAILEEPQKTDWGFRLAGNKSMVDGSFEPVETDVVRKLLNDMDVFVNVGANVGYYCCHALSMGKRVIAFEPMSRNLHFLCGNVQANGWEGVEIFPIALSNRVGILEIFGGGTGASLVKGWAGISENYKTVVPCSTMDIVLNTRLEGTKTLILIDVEGAEKWILEGAYNLLMNDPAPIWVIEITSKELQPLGIAINPNFKSTFEIFFRHGYQAFDLENEMQPMTIELIERIYQGEIEHKSNNFVFRKN